MSYSFAKKILPQVQTTYFNVFVSAESIGTLSFATQAKFLGEKLNFSILNEKKLKNLADSNELKCP